MERTATRPEPPVFIEALPLMAWVTDARGHVVRYNERWQRYVGHDAGLRPSWVSERFIHADDVSRARERWLAARSAGEDLLVELRLRRFDGDYRWHLVTATATLDAEGRQVAWVGTCIDIDAQKQAETDLAFQRSVLEAQGEASLDAIILVSPDRHLLWANRRARELWGKTEDQVPIGSDLRLAAVRTAHRVQDPAAHLAQIDRLYEELGEVIRDDVPMADGRVMERFSAPIIDSNGRLLGRVNTYRDVTARVELVNQLEHEREQLQESLGQVRELNRTMERLAATATLVNDARLDLRDMLEMATEQSRLLVGASVAVMRLGGDPALDQIGQIVSPVGAEAEPSDLGVVTAALSAPLVSAADEQYGSIQLLGTPDDIGFADTDHSVLVQIAEMVSSSIQARLATTHAREQAQASLALDYIADGVVLVGHDGRCHLWNPAAERITGVDADSALGKPLSTMIRDWEDIRSLVPVFERDQKGSSSSAVVPLLLGGSDRWISIAGAATPDGIVYAFRDVSDEQQVERMRADIVSTVSHELRTPLTSIYGLAETLQHRGHALDEHARHELIDVIVEQCSRLATLIDDILIAGSLDAGSLAVRRHAFDVAEEVREVVRTLEPDLPPEITLELDLETHSLGATGDAARFRQVLVNLLDNAVKYSPDGGVVRVGVKAEDDAVAVVVRDEGLGIPPSERERVFERFHRLDPGMVRGIPGTGLGLYISRELVRRMGGSLVIEPTDGPGSTFVVRLPLAAVRTA